MQNQVPLGEKIKLPSNWMLVNPDSIWRFLVCIAKTGNIFNKNQLIKAGLYTNNEDNISRNLSYLKYLGIIEEERGKDKDQRFKVIEQTSVKDIIYELKAGRDEEAIKKLREHLQSHVLFRTLKDEFFEDENTKTLNELEHFLKDGIPGKNPQYYQKGGEFLIKLLGLASLTQLIGNEIKISVRDLESHETTIEVEDNAISNLVHQDSSKAVIPIKKSIFEEAQVVTSDKYFIRFIGPGMNAEYEIQEIDDLFIVDATLSKIKKKLKSTENNQHDF